MCAVRFAGWVAVIAVAEAFDDHAEFGRAPDALFRRLLDGVLVLTPTMDEPVRISSPGDAIWAALAQPITAALLVETLAGLYGAPVETVRRDVEPVLAQLHAWGAIVVT